MKYFFKVVRIYRFSRIKMGVETIKLYMYQRVRYDQSEEDTYDQSEEDTYDQSEEDTYDQSEEGTHSTNQERTALSALQCWPKTA
jgi:hypothetical protein